MAVRVASLGHVPVCAVALSSLHGGTILRKLAQWGPRRVASYARGKLLPHQGNRGTGIINPYLEPFLRQRAKTVRTLRDVAAHYDFPVILCEDQNSPKSLGHVKAWCPDLIIFTGGNILRQVLLQIPRLGVLNVHLGLLPEVRGMSSPEWSLLKRVPVGITIHYMDAGIDTGPILMRCEFANVAQCVSLSDLRHRLIAFGIEKVGDVIEGLARRMLNATPQSDLDQDRQYFVMHERLQALAAQRLDEIRRQAEIATHERVHE
jgi:methionyl-tRNA formyltransferase